jgi:hypothetical protein
MGVVEPSVTPKDSQVGMSRWYGIASSQRPR